jgi:hypothetical protein
MTRGLLNGCFGLTMSLWVCWGAQAQMIRETSAPLVAPSAGGVTTSMSPETPRPSHGVDPKQDDLPEAITRQRQALAQQRNAIGQAEAAQQTGCWQKFAVNACLSEARRTRRQALEPLRQQELALNAQERLWRTEQRERRLQNKQSYARDTP